jgi:hypothetical protein
MGLLNRPRTEASDAGQDLVGRLRPNEGLRGLVACFEVLTDRFFEFCRARVTAAPKSLLGQVGKPALDLIEPRRVGRRKVQREARVSLQPPTDGGRGMDRRVVDDDVYLEVAGTSASIRLRKRRNSTARLSGKQAPITLPVATFNAAKRFVMPCRWYVFGLAAFAILLRRTRSPWIHFCGDSWTQDTSARAAKVS